MTFVEPIMGGKKPLELINVYVILANTLTSKVEDSADLANSSSQAVKNVREPTSNQLQESTKRLAITTDYQMPKVSICNALKKVLDSSE